MALYSNAKTSYATPRHCARRCATFGSGTVSFRVGPGPPVAHDLTIYSTKSQNMGALPI